jgi:hypothetical protein
MKTILTALLICVAILWISPAGFGLSESKYVRHVSTDDSTGSNVTLIIGTNSGTGRIWFGENTGEPGSRNKFRRISKHPDVDGLMSIGMSFVEDSGASVDTHQVALLVQEIRWHTTLPAGVEAELLSRLQPGGYLYTTFGPSGQDKSVCDFVLGLRWSRPHRRLHHKSRWD